MQWSPDEVDGSVFLLPGVVTTKPALLAATGLIDLWGGGPIDIPVGWWLAKGQVWASENLAASLIEFQQDENLKSGRMRVGEDTTGDEPRFIVFLAPDVHERGADKPRHPGSGFGRRVCPDRQESAVPG